MQYPSKLALQVKYVWWTARNINVFFHVCIEQPTWGRECRAHISFFSPWLWLGDLLQGKFCRVARMNWCLLEMQPMRVSKRSTLLSTSPCFTCGLCLTPEECSGLDTKTGKVKLFSTHVKLRSRHCLFIQMHKGVYALKFCTYWIQKRLLFIYYISRVFSLAFLEWICIW